MKYIGKDYTLEGSPEEIKEFLGKENSSTPLYSRYKLTEDLLLFYENVETIMEANRGEYNGFTWIPERGYEAPKGTVLDYVRDRDKCKIFRNEKGTEVKVSKRDIEQGRLIPLK